MSTLELKSPAECMAEARGEMEAIADGTRALVDLPVDAPLGLPQDAIRQRAFARSMDIAVDVLCVTRCPHEDERAMTAVLDYGVAACRECIGETVKGRRLPEDARCTLCRKGTIVGQLSIEMETGWTIIGSVCTDCHAFYPETTT